MNEYYDPEVVKGQVYRVVLVDHGSETVTVEFPNGLVGKITGLDGDLPERGEIIFVHDNGWEVMPDDVWFTNNTIAVVRQVLDDGRLIVEANYVLKMATNPKGLNIAPGNTIEYNDFDGIVSIIGYKPIKGGVLASDEQEPLDRYLYEKAAEGYKFDDFGGYPEVVARARELIQNQLENRPFLDAMKVRPIRGILLTGAPGTGKTFLARIIAQESEAKFFLVNGPTIVSKWLGETENTLRRIFDAAKSSEKGAIIFFDEIDSIAADRSGDTHEASKKLVAQLLTLMDGFDENDGKVIVIAATNRAESLDPAIRRPGRFDWEIEFGQPTAQDRCEILFKAVAKHKVSLGLPITDVVQLTEGWAAAELVLIIAEAGQIAASDKRNEISAEDFAQGYERVAKRSRSI